MVDIKPYLTFFKRPKIIALSLVILTITTLFYHFGRRYYQKYATLIESNQTKLRGILDKGIQLIDKTIEETTAPITNLSTSSLFSQPTSSIDQLIDALKKVIEKHPVYVSGGIALVPQDELRHAVYLTKKNNTWQTKDIGNYTDYTRLDWYIFGIDTGGGWISQTYDPIVESHVLRLIKPFFSIDNNTGTKIIRGIIFVDINRDVLMQGVNDLDLGVSNFAFLTTKTGILISYPIEEYVGEFQTLDDLSRLPGKLGLKDIANVIRQGEIKKIHLFYDELAHEKYYVNFDALTQNHDWNFILFSRAPTLIFNPTIRHMLTHLGLLVLAMIIILLLTIVSWILPADNRWALISAFISLAFLVMTLFQLFVGIKGRERPGDEQIISNKVDLQRFINFISRRNQRLNKPPILFVPTGIWVEYIAQDGDRIQANGILWQKYNNLVIPPDIAKSFGIYNMQQLHLENLYEQKKGDITVVGWRFRTLLNTEFNYFTYPFDSQVIRFKFFHPNFNQNIVLIPDFDSYAASEIGEKIGTEKVHSTSSWQIKSSYFSYSVDDSSTDFGLNSTLRQRDFPNLNYNVLIARNVTSALIGYMMPVIIIIAILFYGFLQSTFSSRVDLAGAIMRASGLFLATVFAHQSLRKSISDLTGINYLEYFYFMVYFLIVFILNFEIFVYMRQKIGKKIDKRIFAYFYWPLFTFLTLIVTLYFFY